MEKYPRPHSEEELDSRAEYLVDSRQVSYSEAYEIAKVELGIEDAADSKPVHERQSPASPEYHGGRYGPQYGEEAGVGYEGGVPPEWQRHEPLSDEQIETNRLGAERVRKAQEEARQAAEEAEAKRRAEEYPDNRNSEPW